MRLPGRRLAAWLAGTLAAAAAIHAVWGLQGLLFAASMAVSAAVVIGALVGLGLLMTRLFGHTRTADWMVMAGLLALLAVMGYPIWYPKYRDHQVRGEAEARLNRVAAAAADARAGPGAYEAGAIAALVARRHPDIDLTTAAPLRAGQVELRVVSANEVRLATHAAGSCRALRRFAHAKQPLLHASREEPESARCSAASFAEADFTPKSSR